MYKRLFKNPAFLTGFIFLFGMLSISIAYFVINGDEVPKVELMKDGKGGIMNPPYSPLQYPPLGTDNFNRNILLLILVGAKYTIGTAILVTMCRVIPSVLIGMFVHFYMKPFRKMLNSIVDAANFFPPSLLAFLLMNWVMLDGPLMDPENFPYDFTDKLLIYFAILVVMSIPSLTLLFTNEYDNIMNYEFIDSSKVLGATKRHFILNHIKPFIAPQIILVFIREFIIVMLLIAHLGVLSIYIGGSSLQTDLFGNNVFVSLSHEWSGLLGSWWPFLWTTYPWIAFVPVVFFTLTILSAKLMLIGSTRVIEHQFVGREKEDSVERKGDAFYGSEDRFTLVRKSLR